jgi:hypothetical protein
MSQSIPATDAELQLIIFYEGDLYQQHKDNNLPMKKNYPANEGTATIKQQ